MSMTISTSDIRDVPYGRDDDREYSDYLIRVQTRFLANVGGGPVFTTDAPDLFNIYLDHVTDRQHHTCHACRRFLESYGGLVTIDPTTGLTSPAIWDEADAPEYYRPAVAAVARSVRRARVTGVFLSAETVWGTPVTPSKSGVTWHHYAVEPPKGCVYCGKVLTAGQAMAEKAEDFKNVGRALAEYGGTTLAQACQLLETESLYRSEKVAGPARWLRDLQSAWDAAKGPSRDNLVWRAVATAPAGFCHPRSSMVGTLLDDIAGGMSFAEASRRFAANMHPLAYQRPQAAPSAGAIVAAEKMVEQLGIARSLERRFARLDEIETVWTPKPKSLADRMAPGGVFGHLTPKDSPPTIPTMSAPAITMTWEKFARVVLPTTTAIDYFVGHGATSYTALVTAAHPDAPPILQWDTPERRNAVSWYFWHGGSSPTSFGLAGGRFRKVTAITLKPSMWCGVDRFVHQGAGVIFILDGAKDTKMAGNALFPEILKSELHGVRSVVEAYSRKAEIVGVEESSACGLGLSKGQTWSDARFRVTSGGSVQEYLLDRWD